jgi:hypothetical protein
MRFPAVARRSMTTCAAAALRDGAALGESVGETTPPGTRASSAGGRCAGGHRRRIARKRRAITVMDGPYTESKELITGFTGLTRASSPPGSTGRAGPQHS